MSAEKKEKSFVDSVDEIPSKKTYKVITYDEIIEEFLESGLNMAKIKPIADKFPRSIYASLQKRVKENKHPCTVCIRGDDLYLKRK